MLPNEEQAMSFAIMLQAGLPGSVAIQYFLTGEEDPKDVAYLLARWQASRAVKKAIQSLLGKSWTSMSLEERCQTALNQHYSGLAYLLHSTHYAEANQGEKSKLDDARRAIEAKIAGTAGKTDALSSFLADVQSGKVKLAGTAKIPLLN